MKKNFYLNEPTIKRSSKKFNIDVESLLFLPGRVNIYWKNSESIYEGCNDTMAEVVGFKTRQTCVGITDHNYNCLPEEAFLYQKQDQEVITSKSPKYFSDHMTINNRKIIFSTFKTPLKNQDGQIVGIFGFSFHLTEFDLKKSLPTFSEANIPINNFQLSNTHNRKNTYNLSTQQIECLSWLTKGMTIKQIAKAMSLSPRTIESYLETIKIKLNCSSRSELIQHALQIPEIKIRLI